jgi:aminocarboxymuconate-semialdehyde decarboxylase
MEHAWRVRAETKSRTTITPREAFRCVCVDTVVHSPEAMRFIVDVFGKDNVVLGTDFPADMGLPDPVNFVNTALGPESDNANAVLRGTAARLLTPKP